MKQLSVPTITLVLCLLASGCAGVRTPLKEQDRASLRTVCVAPQVVMPADAAYFGHVEGVTGIFGIGSALAGRALDEPDRIALNTMFIEQRIDVAAMLRDGFKARLGESALFARVQDDGCDATFRITVERYGLMARNFSPPIPQVWASFVLARPDGTVLWEIRIKQPNEFDFESPVPPMTVDEYRKNPQALRQAFQVVLDIMARKSVTGLRS